jgi:hypothetical protein
MEAINNIKPLSTCGKVALGLFIILDIICVSIAANTTWWQVLFWDCSSGGEFYFYMTMNDGFCTDEGKGTGSGWDDCTSWSDATGGGEAEDAADDFIDANGLLSTFLAFSVILIVLFIASFFIPKQHFNKVRVVAAVVTFLNLIFVLSVFGVTNDNYYYDLSTYDPLPDNCNSEGTLPGVGYFFGILLFPFTLGLLVALVYPICGCMGAKDSSINEPLNNA